MSKPRPHLYSAYEICTAADCRCDHHHAGVWRAEDVTLVEAYRSMSPYPGYRRVIVCPDGREVEIATQ